MRKDPPNRQEFPPVHPSFAADPDAQAVHRLLLRCGAGIHGSSAAVAGLLVNLHNSMWKEVDMSYLCRAVDDATFADVVSALRWMNRNRQFHILDVLADPDAGHFGLLMQRFQLGPYTIHQ